MSVDLRFIYRVGRYDINRQKVISNICNIASQHITLPNYIEIEFCSLNQNVYAETLVNFKFKNRIRINESISIKELVKPLVHELIHLNQIHTGKLQTNDRGIYLWENIPYRPKSDVLTNYDSYVNLPWEVDARAREDQLLLLVLKDAE